MRELVFGLNTKIIDKISEWFGKRWKEIKGLRFCIAGYVEGEVKKESIDEPKSLKQFLRELDKKLDKKNGKLVIIVDDLQL